MRLAAALAVLMGAQSVLLQAEKAPFTFHEMMKLGRVGDPQLSPDGKTVAFMVQTVDMVNNAMPTQIRRLGLREHRTHKRQQKQNYV